MIKNRKLFAVLMVAMLLVSGAMGVYAAMYEIASSPEPLDNGSPYGMEGNLYQYRYTGDNDYYISAFTQVDNDAIIDYETYLYVTIAVTPATTNENNGQPYTDDNRCLNQNLAGVYTDTIHARNVQSASGTHSASIRHRMTGVAHYGETETYCHKTGMNSIPQNKPVTE